MSHTSAAALPAGTEQLALVAAFCQRSNDARAARLGMRPVMLEHKGNVLPDEFRTRYATVPSRPGQPADRPRDRNRWIGLASLLTMPTRREPAWRGS